MDSREHVALSRICLPRYTCDMKNQKKEIKKLTPAQKGKLIRRVYALRGKYKNKGLMKAFLQNKKSEKSV